MINYIIRRILYAIPIIIGVNIIVFILFFLVNTPDDMAELHLGKRVTPEQIDRWKAQHSLDLPDFRNEGFVRIETHSLVKKKNQIVMSLKQKGNYQMVFESPKNIKAASAKEVKAQWQSGDISSDDLHLDKPLILPKTTEKQKIEFRSEKENVQLKLNVSLEQPGLSNRILISFQEDISFFEQFTRTIFFQKSVRMLFFQFGKSDRGKDIGKQIRKRIIPSLSLTIPAFILGIFTTVFVAMILAFFRGGPIDKWGSVMAIIAMSISQLFYIIFCQFIFGKVLKVVPISGFAYGIESLKFLALPIFISVVIGLGSGARFYRTVFLEEINRDYVRTARAKGMAEHMVLFIHVLKNAMIPILTQVVVSLPLLFAGSLILEAFFAIPGLGSYLLDAIRQQDFSVVQSMVFLLSFMYIIGLILTDISYTLVDPRVRLE